MSMSWFGDMLLGCIIKWDEIDQFTAAYIDANPEEFKGLSETEAVAHLNDLMSCNESLTAASGNKEDSFNAMYYDDTSFEGLHFIAASPDVTIDEELDCRKGVLFIGADKPIYSRGVFKGEFYQNYDQLENEFRKKIEAYLPSTFDYATHIGDLSFAVCC